MLRFFLFLLLLLGLRASAQPPKPDTRLWVADYGQILSPAEEAILEAALADLEQQKGVEFVVATINSLEGAQLQTYSQRWAETWEIGKKGKDNGLLLLIALEERKIRLEVGYGLETLFSDLQSRQLLDECLRPALREERALDGLACLLTRVFYQLGASPPESLLQRAPEEVQVQLKRNDKGQVLLPAGVPPRQKGRFFYDEAGLLPKDLQQQWMGWLQGKIRPDQLLVLSLKELPPGFAQPSLLFRYLQKAWNFPRSGAQRQAFVLLVTSENYFQLAASQPFEKIDLRAWNQRLWPRLNQELGFEQAAQQAIRQLLIELPPQAAVGPAAWSETLVAQAQLPVYEAYQGFKTRQQLLLYLLLFFVALSLLDWSFVLFKRLSGTKPRWMYSPKPYMRVLAFVLLFVLLLWLDERPVELLAYKQLLASSQSNFTQDLLFYVLVYGCLYAVWVFIQAVRRSDGGSYGGTYSSSGYSSSSSYSSSSYSSSSSSSYGGGSFGGGGASSSW